MANLYRSKENNLNEPSLYLSPNFNNKQNTSSQFCFISSYYLKANIRHHFRSHRRRGSVLGSERSPGVGNGTRLLWPRRFHGQRIMVDYSPRGHKESGNDWVTEHTHMILWLSFLKKRVLIHKRYMLKQLHLLDHWKSKRVPEKHLRLLYWLCQSLWLCGSQ